MTKEKIIPKLPKVHRLYSIGKKFLVQSLLLISFAFIFMALNDIDVSALKFSLAVTGQLLFLCLLALLLSTDPEKFFSDLEKKNKESEYASNVRLMVFSFLCIVLIVFVKDVQVVDYFIIFLLIILALANLFTLHVYTFYKKYVEALKSVK